MPTLIGLLELIAWILVVLVIAAGITYGVIKLFPSREDKPKPEDATSTPAGS
jgi:hypothetical protein